MDYSLPLQISAFGLPKKSNFMQEFKSAILPIFQKVLKKKYFKFFSSTFGPSFW